MSRLRTLDSAFVAVLVAVSGTVVLAFIANSPSPDRFPDTAAYEKVAYHLPGSFISSERLPGYPLLLALASWLPGGSTLDLLVLQGLMTVGAVVLTYYIGRLALGPAWMAFIAALLVATDLLMAGFARVAMSESLAVLLTLSVAATAVAYLRSPGPQRLWLMTGLMLVLFLTRPEWAPLALVLVPYIVVVLARRGLLSRKLLGQAAMSVAAILLSIGAYSVGNLAVNGYFGISSVLNVALMGKVMVYRMEGEAPPPYDSLAGLVSATGPAQGPWALTNVPPFNDRNHRLEGDFARAVILHRPVRFAEHVVGTLLGASSEYDTAFIRIHDPGAFAGPLKSLLDLSTRRYAFFILMLPLTFAWAVMGLAARPDNTRAHVIGALSVMALYGAVTTAATTFDEFGRIHMLINPISTLIVVGTLLFNLTQVLQRRLAPAVAATAALALEAFAIVWLPGRSSSVMLVCLGVITLLQLVATIAGSTVAAASGDVARRGLGGRTEERPREQLLENR